VFIGSLKVTGRITAQSILSYKLNMDTVQLSDKNEYDDSFKCPYYSIFVHKVE
jgi:hypothetical protein